MLILTVAGIAGSYCESVLGSWNRKQAEPIPNGVMNFINTAIGAAASVALSLLIWNR